MRVLRLIVLVVAVLCCIIPLSACRKNQVEEDAPVYLEMNTAYPSPDSLPDGQGQRVKVVLLLGQSNATGCSINEYLKKGLDEQQYERYAAGFESVLINYCLDDHNATSEGAFVKVDLSCGATDGFFGPEVGMAEVLSDAYPDETVMIIKYTMSGYSLHYHWLRQGQRGSIYDAFLSFAKLHMDYLLSKNYDAKIGAICWMQGESDTTDFKASHYYDNQTAFVSYLREDLEPYAEEGGIYFIDAGISNSPYCEPAYPAINEAKVRFSADSPQNLYFSTIDAGFTVHLEPVGDPDWGHYDALSELRLGQMFGHYIVQSYQIREHE